MQCYEQNYGSYRYLAALLILLLVTAFWWFGWDLSHLAVTVGIGLLPSLLTALRTRYILVPGVLMIWQNAGSDRRIPLGTAELRRQEERAEIIWWDREKRRTTVLHLPDGFADELGRAVLAARQGDGPSPATVSEAKRVAPLGLRLTQPPGRWLALLLVLIAAAVGLGWLALWLGQPLVLLPLVLLPWALGRDLNEPVLLQGETLWLFHAGAQPRAVALDLVREITAGTSTHTLLLAEGAPVVLNSHYSTELIKQAKKRLG